MKDCMDCRKKGLSSDTEAVGGFAAEQGRAKQHSVNNQQKQQEVATDGGS